MSKKYKGITCVYCNVRLSDTADHVFSREFFLPTDRDNHPKVPACSICNQEKSKLEYYLTTILPFAGRHLVAKTNLEKMVPNRLANNDKLRKLLSQGMRRIWVNEKDGLILPVSSIPLDTHKIEKYFSLVAKGLVWHYWKTLLTSEHFIEVRFLTKWGEDVFENQFFSIENVNHVAENLGNGTVVYKGIQEIGIPEMTAWRLFFYGGMSLLDELDVKESSSSIGLITGPMSIKKGVVA